ncbi:uncharacterized protein LOC127250305 [Andrographis paniculata]|uniref:uncharacterized protein LOC127250305 n=1 Tax=Andrographis paniculata TaxID=175694 RepID=UPI0021E82B50|nr:uncharacterized protein LOC127250305 [Andrographis paniculata]
MERSVGSGGVLKKKSSSGCLIIKQNRNSRGLGDLASVNGGKEKKRARVATSSSSSSSDEDESLELMRRRVNERRLHNGSSMVGHHKSGYAFENRDNVGTERKRSRLDLFDFDEYDEFDINKARNEYPENRFMPVGVGVGSSQKRNLVVDKRRRGLNFNSLRSKGVELEDDDANMPISLLRLKCKENGDKPIRLQGKNGVLKVMVNKRKKMDLPSQQKSYDSRGVNERESSWSDDGAKRDLLPRSPMYAVTNLPENKGMFVDKEKSVEKVKRKGKKSNKVSSKSEDSDDDKGTEIFLKMAPHAKRRMKKEDDDERTPAPENLGSVKGKEAKAKRGGGSTEKQMLREKIRGMLVDAGWSIDYRPRRNREYLDAVYINPSGTAYWSIIKAYEALKKQLEEENGKSDAIVASPLSDDLINKLTRQTKKKMEDGASKSVKKPAVKQAADDSDSENEDNAKIGKSDQDSDDEEDVPRRKPAKQRAEKSSAASKGNIIQGRTSKVLGRCTLLVRGSEQGGNSDSDGYVPYKGKRTVLAWLINTGTAKLSEKVQYMNRKRTRVLLEGWITSDGIHCGCCSKILTVSKFELHAGSKLRQPFQNILLESGSSLLQCQVDAWNGQDVSLCRDFHTVDVDGDDPDDDTCGICGDGGDLICCDSCPSTFHQICLEIQILPKGDWHCPNCKCKFCGLVEGEVAEENRSAGNELNRCSFCENKYHKSCSESVLASSMISNGGSFCSPKCQEIYEHLQKNVGVKHELDAGFSWSIIQRTDVSDASQRGFSQRVECNSKLAVALSVMDECFLPIIDRRSGVNIVHNVVYNCGSNFNRLNFNGFYTVILERGDEIMCAASIRLRGTHLAEMPFIGTREMYRRQGMCRRLLSVIETELRSLKVERLIIPAISEHTSTWTTVFGFHKLDDVHKKEIKLMNLLVFPGTDMLQKQLLKLENSEVNISESTKNLPKLPDLVEKFDTDSPPDHARQASSDSGVDAPELSSNLDKESESCARPKRSPVPENDNSTKLLETTNSDSAACAIDAAGGNST